MNNKPIITRLIWAFLFAISMGYFEAAVVADLRHILCPDTLTIFPLNIDSGNIGIIELGRELFSLIMLISVAAILSTKRITGIFWFFILFGVWDIFYYIFLKIMINWPESLLSWDILFLLPVPWVAPVLAPVIISMTLICISIYILYLYDKDRAIKNMPGFFITEIFAVAVMLISFCWQWKDIIAGGIPHNFPWFIFALSEILMLFFFRLFAVPSSRKGMKNNEK